MPDKKTLVTTSVKKVHLTYKLGDVDLNFNFNIESRTEIRTAIEVLERVVSDLKDIVKTIPSKEI